ncbi:hypothetical protein PLESTB_001381600 [Pleodorina starrii]|uniref:Uncharacterized protein n=1 Tax=Pleodorina starrii TaxID=330485 RepID=A0A9W6BVJ8_9CHLO|nr:hypothetical protein PLESTM_000403600 [Pleodorina starrii]GLC58625.1 hypothetical protein PLESTB_001381600 [Pleodorina starrii]GLC67468.1 hypothetical protein PLESTF_000560800 [Pleodorina starrii]
MRRQQQRQQRQQQLLRQFAAAAAACGDSSSGGSACGGAVAAAAAAAGESLGFGGPGRWPACEQAWSGRIPADVELLIGACSDCGATDWGPSEGDVMGRTRSRSVRQQGTSAAATAARRGLLPPRVVSDRVPWGRVLLCVPYFTPFPPGGCSRLVWLVWYVLSGGLGWETGLGGQYRGGLDPRPGHP